jgi:hypothetical protein
MFAIRLNLDLINRFSVRIADGWGSSFYFLYERIQWRRQWYVITMIHQGRVDGNDKGEHSPQLYRDAKKLKLIGMSNTSRFHDISSVYLLLGHIGVGGGVAYNYVGEMAIFRILPYILSSEDIYKIRGTHRSITGSATQ